MVQNPDENIHTWDRLYRVTPQGEILARKDSKLPDNPQDGSLKSTLLACARIVDTASGLTQSGFWLDCGLFMTALHFAAWAGPTPTRDELDDYTRKDPYIYVCDGPRRMDTGLRDTPVVQVSLFECHMGSGYAFFRPVDNGYAPRYSISATQFLEICYLEDFIKFRPDLEIFICGYSGYRADGWEDHLDYLRVMDIHMRKIFEPKFRKLLAPDYKTATFGTVKLFDHMTEEIVLDCPVAAGYTGALVAAFDKTGRWANGQQLPAVRIIGFRKEGGPFTIAQCIPVSFPWFVLPRNANKLRLVRAIDRERRISVSVSPDADIGYASLLDMSSTRTESISPITLSDCGDDDLASWSPKSMIGLDQF